MLREAGLLGATFIGIRKLPQVRQSWRYYQNFISGKDYEEVWQLPDGSKVALDSIDSGYVVDAKYTGGNFASSPYNPVSGVYNEAKLVNQLSRQIQFSRSQGLKGVRWVASNTEGQETLDNLFRQYFPEDYQSGFIRVYYVPEWGMWELPLDDER